MPSPNRKVVKSYLNPDEYQQVINSAAKARLSVSTFVKRVCLFQDVRGTVDHQAIHALAKTNADMGRLGGLFKMFLSEGKAGQQVDELKRILKSIESTKAQLTKDYQRVVKEYENKGRS